MQLSNIKLIVLDVDGVLTSGKKAYDLNGKVIFKEFYDKDLSALNRLKEMIEVIFISGDDRVNKELLGKNFEFIHEYKAKWELLKEIMKQKQVKNTEVIFIGDDLPDVDCLRNLPYSFCPADAAPDALLNARKILQTSGGNGVIVELYNLLMKG